MFKIFKKLTPVDYAKKAIKDAQEALVINKLQIEHMSSLVVYNQEQIRRLEKFIRDNPQPCAETLQDRMRGKTL